jgi:glycosyltransferase involved in cell wall biosynthesis
MHKPLLICLTPIKNEAWILDRFLQCASTWADHIIIADQLSTDGSREIAAKYEKVILIDNNSTQFNELDRQKLLIKTARQFPTPSIFIALDADEILSANFQNSPEWKTLLNSSPGTVFQFERMEIFSSPLSYLKSSSPFLPGYFDDGSDHLGTLIHSPRIPLPPNARRVFFQDIKVLHYQYTDWDRMKSKHRWYKCWEMINQPDRRAIDIFRQYHHMDVLSKDLIHTVPSHWISGYESLGIDMTSVVIEPYYWWDLEVLCWIEKYGSNFFSKHYIWDVNWQYLAESLDQAKASNDFRDPRSKIEKMIHRWLQKSQASPHSYKNRFISRLLLFLGW